MLSFLLGAASMWLWMRFKYELKALFNRAEQKIEKAINELK